MVAKGERTPVDPELDKDFFVLSKSSRHRIFTGHQYKTRPDVYLLDLEPCFVHADDLTRGLFGKNISFGVDDDFVEVLRYLSNRVVNFPDSIRMGFARAMICLGRKRYGKVPVVLDGPNNGDRDDDGGDPRIGDGHGHDGLVAGETLVQVVHLDRSDIHHALGLATHAFKRYEGAGIFNPSPQFSLNCAAKGSVSASGELGLGSDSEGRKTGGPI
ncbi:hypothetical protein BDK51DRAFT_50124 [Blyttiomyces helicus]|uniref:Uncharacterized protein n=1 Tax=Blyttiomyces helicus TaxID=388810 RepID=A0A4P9VUI4_9FUNG|nr:hypothetical protein BDK51DRAFT_50124 [Blyttiomyces helicus]|eukprot:RKO83259.1 hypothetical protein BDK51DRAFT_50124 [Blyttiomyces helicus]